MKANATQLLVILAPGLLKPLCYSLNLSFILPPTLSSLPASHSFVVTYRPCRRTPSSLNQVCFPSSHRHHSALFTPPPLSPLYPIMPWGWNRKKKTFSLLYISPYQSFTLLLFPAVGSPQHTHTHPDTHTSLARRWTVARCRLLYGWAGLFLLIADREAHCGAPLLAHRKAGWGVELSEEANEERGRDGGEPFEG